MATGEAAQILDALLAHCATLSVGSPAMQIVMPEPQTPFTPQKDANKKLIPYLQVDFFPNRPAWEGITNGKLAQGILLITVIWPRGQDLIAANEAAQAVMDHFAKGLPLIDATGSVRVTISAEPYTVAPIFEDTDLRIPITIPWVAAAI